MSRHPIDQIFKQRLGRRRESVPTELWEGIAARRAEARRKRRVLRWVYGGGGMLLLALFSAAYFYGSDLLLGPAEATEPVNRSSANPPSTASTPTTKPGTLLPASDAPGQPLPATPQEQPDTDAATAELRTAPSVRSSAPTTGQTAIRNREETGTPSWIIRPRARTEKAAESNPQPVRSDHSTEHSSQERPAEPRTTYPDHYRSTTPTTEDTGVSGPHRRRHSQESASVETLSPRQILPASIQEDASPSRRVANLRCYDISRKRYRFEAEWLAGPTLGRQILAKRLDEAQGHLEDRRSTETARPGFGGGFRFSVVSPRGVALRTGVQYTELRNRFEFALPGESTTIITERYDPAGNVIGIDTSFSTEKLMYSTTNRLRMVELPLLAGYEFQWNQLRVALTAGAHVNLWFDAQGQLLSPTSGNATDFGQVGDSNVFPIYTRQAGVGLYAGAALLYHLGGRYSLLCEPFIKSYPRSLTRNEYVLRENYWLAGLQIGLRVRL